jgi:hypothetical protein
VIEVVGLVHQRLRFPLVDKLVDFLLSLTLTLSRNRYRHLLRARPV